MFRSFIKISLMLIVPVLIVACMSAPVQQGTCPQPRFTGKAPLDYYSRVNPFAVDRDTIATGKQLYLHDAATVSCAKCHGDNGDGQGPMSSMFDPPPRNFTCSKTITGVPDGQLFWIIKHGSPGTSMPAFDKLSDDQIWQIVIYLRQLANGHHDS